MSNSHLYMKSGYLSAHLGNGITRYVCQLKRVTLKFCKNHGCSRGLRDFIEHDLIDYARSNTGTVVYLKPRRHRSPIIVAEYLDGSKHWIACNNFQREEVIKWMELLKTQARDGTAKRLRRLWHTDFPSIQGPWTPFTFKDPALNLSEYPDTELGAAVKLEETATEKLIELFKAQKLSEQSKNNDPNA
ncbi:39S ribosomal protein L43, mitochondrial [Leptopilina heterotoma]|uniref:39S ribosomal protein L43, mitochondrial n=1 Tax=Leptopilina heterotoma TaxID=63436 RepID=UPI001CA8952F|nr:39S ribosomal protein L43, mitochondrial [Leptopilina heterotoma]